MRQACAGLVAFFAAGAGSQRLELPNFVLGVNAMGGQYAFHPKESLLTELVAGVVGLGGNQIKMRLEPKACDIYDLDCEDASSLSSLAKVPGFAKVTFRALTIFAEFRSRALSGSGLLRATPAVVPAVDELVRPSEAAQERLDPCDGSARV